MASDVRYNRIPGPSPRPEVVAEVNRALGGTRRARQWPLSAAVTLNMRCRRVIEARSDMLFPREGHAFWGI